jgi:hypothetical protein
MSKKVKTGISGAGQAGVCHTKTLRVFPFQTHHTAIGSLSAFSRVLEPAVG